MFRDRTALKVLLSETLFQLKCRLGAGLCLDMLGRLSALIRGRGRGLNKRRDRTGQGKGMGQRKGDKGKENCAPREVFKSGHL